MEVKLKNQKLNHPSILRGRLRSLEAEERRDPDRFDVTFGVSAAAESSGFVEVGPPVSLRIPLLNRKRFQELRKLSGLVRALESARHHDERLENTSSRQSMFRSRADTLATQLSEQFAAERAPSESKGIALASSQLVLQTLQPTSMLADTLAESEPLLVDAPPVEQIVRANRAQVELAHAARSLGAELQRLDWRLNAHQRSFLNRVIPSAVTLNADQGTFAAPAVSAALGAVGPSWFRTGKLRPEVEAAALRARVSSLQDAALELEDAVRDLLTEGRQTAHLYGQRRILNECSNSRESRVLSSRCALDRRLREIRGELARLGLGEFSWEGLSKLSDAEIGSFGSSATRRRAQSTDFHRSIENSRRYFDAKRRDGAKLSALFEPAVRQIEDLPEGFSKGMRVESGDALSDEASARVSTLSNRTVDVAPKFARAFDGKEPSPSSTMAYGCAIPEVEERKR